MTTIETGSFFAMPNVIENVVSGFESFRNAGFKAIVRGAVFAKLRIDAGSKVKATRDELTLLIVKAGVPLSSANNYASRSLTVLDFWRFGDIDQTISFVDYCALIMPSVTELWDDVNDIKKSGPSAERDDKVAMPRATKVVADGSVALADASPEQLGAVVGKRLVDLDTQTLIDLGDAIKAELAHRTAATMRSEHEAVKLAA